MHADGLVLIHAARGTVFSSNRVGAMIWRGAAERWNLAALTAAISGEFDVPQERARTDALAFLAQLEKAGLLLRDAN